jgi:hypothetical protein
MRWLFQRNIVTCSASRDTHPCNLLKTGNVSENLSSPKRLAPLLRSRRDFLVIYVCVSRRLTIEGKDVRCDELGLSFELVADAVP